MASDTAIDELHITVRVSDDLTEDEVEAVRRTLAGADFLDRLQRAILVAVRSFPELTATSVSLTR